MLKLILTAVTTAVFALSPASAHGTAHADTGTGTGDTCPTTPCEPVATPLDNVDWPN
ncbi:hypothetical protein ACFQY4_21415 [Catellatospora bangladeshensis]|uniref:Uncharacterized protein n=1 Tax=Catellatospora bangladeshensis TaxID=310355 RepID=A0A8J3JWI1_9ACTN|nr:hypothetical protein [Catellatospora bangladeshensis]GIF84369.1 hypothetical protein Cba03nite_57180 [Catellatospora bangladeshensis]